MQSFKNTKQSLDENVHLSSEKKQLLLKVALLFNKELFEEKHISYQLYKSTEESIFKELKHP